MKKSAIAICICLTISMGLAFLYQGVFAAKSQVATLSGVKGTVVFKGPGDKDWKAAYDKAVLNQGDTIKTGESSSAIIKYADGTMVKLGSLAVTTLEKIGGGQTAGGGVLNVGNGKAWSRVRKQGADSTFNVKTPVAVAGVRGTYFTSEAQKDSSQFDVFDGEVEVSSAADPSKIVDVKAHQRTTVAGEKPPAAPAQIPAEDEQKGRSGFTEQEVTNAAFDIQVSINPSSLKPGEKASLSVQVLQNNAPAKLKANLHLTLSGSAVFAQNNANEINVTTDDKGAIKLDISDSAEETVSVEASMTVKVVK